MRDQVTSKENSNSITFEWLQKLYDNFYSQPIESLDIFDPGRYGNAEAVRDTSVFSDDKRIILPFQVSYAESRAVNYIRRSVSPQSIEALGNVGILNFFREQKLNGLGRERSLGRLAFMLFGSLEQNETMKTYIESQRWDEGDLDRFNSEEVGRKLAENLILSRSIKVQLGALVLLGSERNSYVAFELNSLKKSKISLWDELDFAAKVMGSNGSSLDLSRGYSKPHLTMFDQTTAQMGQEIIDLFKSNNPNFSFVIELNPATVGAVSS